MNSKVPVRLAAILCLLALAVPLDGQAQQRKATEAFPTEVRRVVRLSTNTTTTDISGNSAPYYRTFRGERNYVLKALSFSERSDDPCYVKAHFVTARHGAGTEDVVTEEPFGRTDDLCGPTSNDMQLVSVGNTPATLEAIHAIKVGLNRRGDKLKAVTVYGSTIDQDEAGEVRRDAGMEDDFERPNFKKPWKDKVSCEPGAVAVGLVIYYNKDHAHASIEGLALECAEVSVHEYTYREGTNDRVGTLN